MLAAMTAADQAWCGLLRKKRAAPKKATSSLTACGT
jgi:hypothetical protein